jgi:putative ABC transport system substrate-binding protein
VRRRTFIAGLGAAAAWPLAARGQQSATPVIGILDSRSAGGFADNLRAFRQGLKEAGYVEGENLAIEFRFAEDQPERLPALAADLVRRRVALIATGTANAAPAAKAATSTIPVVFVAAGDPTRTGLVASLARPGGNLTGVNFVSAEVSAKRLELLRALVPGITHLAVLIDDSAPASEGAMRDIVPAASEMGIEHRVIRASTAGEIDAAFASLDKARPDAVFVGPSPFFNARRIQLAQWASYQRVPATYSGRQYVEAGGLMSYGANQLDAFRQMGAYAGRILKGAKPGELPVVQSSKLELLINHQTARILGLTVPPTLLATADEVIE